MRGREQTANWQDLFRRRCRYIVNVLINCRFKAPQPLSKLPFRPSLSIFFLCPNYYCLDMIWLTTPYCYGMSLFVLTRSDYSPLLPPAWSFLFSNWGLLRKKGFLVKKKVQKGGASQGSKLLYQADQILLGGHPYAAVQI